MSGAGCKEESEPRCSFDHNYSLLSASICPNEKTSCHTEKLDSIICQFLVEQNVPGATLAVAHNGCIVYEQGYGVAGVGRRMRGRTALRVASISKTITAIAVLRLCQEGVLSLDDVVFGKDGILKIPKARHDKRLPMVTVRHLLQHSAGWDRDVGGDAVFFKISHPEGIESTSSEYNLYLLQCVLKKRLHFTPGTRHAYSNLGYLVLGEVIEAVTGQTYQAYVTSMLSLIGITSMYVGREQRASLQSSEAEYFNNKEPTTAASVMPGQEGSMVLPQYGSYLMANTGAFGGWVATAHDLLLILSDLEGTFHQSFTSDKVSEDDPVSLTMGSNTKLKRNPQAILLNCITLHSMLECPSYESGLDWYGLGLDVQDHGNTWGHTGAMEGTCATMQRHHSGISWAFVLNAWASDMDLDGVVKLALSSVESLCVFPHGLADQYEDVLCVTTKDDSQCIMVHVPYENLFTVIDDRKLQGYFVVWIGVNSANQKWGTNLSFNIVFAKGDGLGERKILNVEISEFQTILLRYCEDGFHPDSIMTYVSGDVLFGMAVFSESDIDYIIEADVGVPAREYVKLLDRRKRKGFRVVNQCVMPKRSEQVDMLMVTAVMEKAAGTKFYRCAKTKSEENMEISTDFCEEMKTEDSGQVHTEVGEQFNSSWKKSNELREDQTKIMSTSSADNKQPPPEMELSSQEFESSESPGAAENSDTFHFWTGTNEYLQHGSKNSNKTLLSTKEKTRKHRKNKIKFSKTKLKNLSWVQMPVDSFVAEMRRQAGYHHDLRDVCFYPVDGEWFVSGVWSPNHARYYHRMAVSQLGLLPALAEAAANNVHLKFLCQYEEEGVLHYALFWKAS